MGNAPNASRPRFILDELASWSIRERGPWPQRGRIPRRQSSSKASL
jgi:hypothetical protein